MRVCWSDTETFSAVPITHGTHAYAAGVEVMLWAYAFDEDPVMVWDLTTGAPMPSDLRGALADEDCLFWFHNSHFDRTVLRAVGYEIPTHRVRDTMVQALSHGLPGKLDTLCEILEVPHAQAKDKAGKALIQLFCKPRPAGSRIERATRDTHPQEWARFVEYAGLDITAMREVARRLPAWNYRGAELDLWHLDQRINDRGVAIDMGLVRAAVATIAEEQARLRTRTQEMTDGQVTSTTRRDQLLGHILEAYGVDLPDMQMATLERRIADPELPLALRELLAIRLQASSTSTGKYAALARGTSADGRLRGTLQFNGAGRTGRWAGRLFQPQNLPRPTLAQPMIDIGIDAIKAGGADLITGNVTELVSSAVRGAIIAPPGRKLVVADLSNIEGRDQAWLAGEEWKLQAFRDFDAGVGPDLYKLAYGKSFGVPASAVTKDQRQVGKVQELALGYEGGVGAFVTFAAAYGIDLDDLAAKVLPVAPFWAVEEAGSFHAWTEREARPTFGLSRDAFVACDAVKRTWRSAHAATSSYWPELRSVVVEAIENPGNTLPCRRLKVRRDGAWLRIGLPSGRALCYPSPQVDGTAVTYMGLNQYSRKWCRLTTYGGKLFENVCQAVARDVMAHNMPAIEAAGYQIVLTVHDEVICEAPDHPDFNANHLASLLAANPPWAPDMPLAAAGFECHRYRKE